MPRGERAPVLVIWVGKRLARRGGYGLFDLLLCGFLPLPQRGGIGPAVGECVGFGECETIAAHWRSLEVRIDVARIVVFAVTHESEERADDELRAVPGRDVY